MYFSQQSPGIQQKLAHDQNAWSRSTPGYAIYNGAPMHPHALVHPPMHHHQNSLSQYPSPPSHQTLSPASLPGPPPSQHWQQQMIKYEVSRQSRSPHHRARQNAMASRGMTKSVIPITNPNSVKVVPGDASPDTSPATINHPSATVAPVSQAPRPTATKPPENAWTSLDMGGVNIKNLPPTSALFSFQFLICLYLNHNALASIPPQIARLRHLEVLDLSGNLLTSLPPEIGMLTQLKELYLFDNHITSLPPQLGTLHQLQTLGIEGNPIDPNTKNIIQTSGTASLIATLRDNCPNPPEPPGREWKYMVPPAEYNQMKSDPSVETVSVLCYNILCPFYATEKLYGYTPTWALKWDYRKQKIMREIEESQADFICLQEVDVQQFSEYFTPTLGNMSYGGVYRPKGRQVDGCAVFYRKDKYALLLDDVIQFNTVALGRPDFDKGDDMFGRIYRRDDICVVCVFKNRETGSTLVVLNAHIYWDPAYKDVKLVQVGIMMEQLELILKAQQGDDVEDITTIPTLVCGDYNSIPSSGVYEFLSTGYVPPTHPDFMDHDYGKFTKEGMRHRFGLKSAYSGYWPHSRAKDTGLLNDEDNTELCMTNYIPSFRGVLDYVWYSQASMSTTRVLGDPDKNYVDRVVGFPNCHFPSDHISLSAEFRLKAQREKVNGVNGSRPP